MKVQHHPLHSPPLQACESDKVEEHPQKEQGTQDTSSARTTRGLPATWASGAMLGCTPAFGDPPGDRPRTNRRSPLPLPCLEVPRVEVSLCLAKPASGLPSEQPFGVQRSSPCFQPGLLWETPSKAEGSGFMRRCSIIIFGCRKLPYGLKHVAPLDPTFADPLSFP